ncbi:MAG: DEAD/DEAH box helicase [Pseudomonadota bacterium]|nr:DEAD/DEAH box helicase [Pseudomonadota bacterium]
MKHNLIPLSLAHEVKENILGYLNTTYNIHNRTFNTALQKFLQQNLCHPPYIDIKLPFKQADNNDTGLDLSLPFTPFVHQTQAMQRLTSKNKLPDNTIIVTGTGSGKSECFFVPIIDHCLRERHTAGIKAILIYPMNALANDQASRIVEFLFNNQAITPDSNKLPLVSVGMLIGDTRDRSGRSGRSKVMHKTYQDGKETYHIIDDRNTMIANPPDILLTNYKMLDYLLMKPEFANLWQQPATLQYLVLDEMHTYDGAQGADVAFLIRRLKAKLNLKRSEAKNKLARSFRTSAESIDRRSMNLNNITCVGTSATLVSNTDSQTTLTVFAEKLFGEKFTHGSIITETCQTVDEVFQNIDNNLTTIPPDTEALDYRQYKTLAEYLQAQTTLWFANTTINDNTELAQYIQRHTLTYVLIKIFAEIDKPLTEQQLLKNLSDKRHQLSSAQLASYLALLVHTPLYHVRVQLWLRELRRLLVSLDNDKPQFVWQEDIDENKTQAHLPPVFCEECGEVGYLCARACRHFA